MTVIISNAQNNYNDGHLVAVLLFQYLCFYPYELETVWSFLV